MNYLKLLINERFKKSLLQAYIDLHSALQYLALFVMLFLAGQPSLAIRHIGYSSSEFLESTIKKI